MNGNADYFSISKKAKILPLSKHLLYAKLLFRYALLYVFAFILGCILFHSLKIENSQVINSRIYAFFNTDFSGCETLFDKANLLLNISNTDISHLIIIFTAGFTMLVGVMISLLLVFRGFSLGFSISYFTYALQNDLIDLKSPKISIILFSVICAITASIMIHFSVKTTCFCDTFKSFCGVPRRILKSKELYYQFFRFLITLGLILILNLFRCVL